MAIEEEFSIEIPDKEADAIHSGRTSRWTKYLLPFANDLQLNKR